MKKLYCLFILLTVIVTFAGFASASTIIGGQITDRHSAPVNGASVTVSCNGQDMSTTSQEDGTYFVTYDENCPFGSDITIYAFREDLGEANNYGTIENNYPDEVWNLELALPPPGSTTRIYGTIYQDTINNPVEGARVITDCGGSTLETVSLTDGTYSIDYPSDFCSNMHKLTVYATTESGLYGSADGVVQDNAEVDLNLAKVDVPLVPEFGPIVGLTTLIGALGVFFVIRKK